VEAAINRCVLSLRSLRFRDRDRVCAAINRCTCFVFVPMLLLALADFHQVLVAVVVDCS
jgi:hypothetical protein